MPSSPSFKYDLNVTRRSKARKARMKKTSAVKRIQNAVRSHKGKRSQRKSK